MTRKIHARMDVTGTLVALAPLHVGGVGEDPEADLVLARDGQGRYYVPGTSLAGPLRAWMANRVDRDRQPLLDILWGFQSEPRPGEDADGQASALFLFDAPIENTKDQDGGSQHAEDPPARAEVAVEIREGVGIDRFTGTAASGIKYNRAVLPRGTRMPFHLTAELKDGKNLDALLFLVCEMIERLEKGDIRFGAARTRGHGKVVLEQATVRTFRLDTRDGMMALLRWLEDTPQRQRRGGAPHLTPVEPGQGDRELLDAEGGRTAGAAGCSPGSYKRDLLVRLGGTHPVELVPRPRLSLEIDWEPVGPLMVKAEGEGNGVDMLPQTTRDAPDNSPVRLLLPGSALKGVFRSRAEWIVRTVLPQDATATGDKRPDFLDQVEVPLVRELFGTRKHGSEEEQGGVRGDGGSDTSSTSDRNIDGDTPSRETAGPAPRAGLGALTTEDCRSTWSTSRETWESIVSADKASLEARSRNGSLLPFQQAFHVAVDRWTGGAAGSFLYTVLEPHGGAGEKPHGEPGSIAWEPLRLEVDLCRIDADHQAPALTLLLLVMRDLAAGWVPLGYGTNRGMGTIKVRNIILTGHELEPGRLKGTWLEGHPLTGLTRIEMENGDLSNLPDDIRDHLEKGWGHLGTHHRGWQAWVEAWNGLQGPTKRGEAR